MGRERRTLRGVELQADRVAEIAHRPVAELRRRDVAIALLSVPAEDALASLPVIRRGMLAAGNPLSAPFWESAEAILHKIGSHDATFGDVHGWLEATGTEPTGIIGLHVWEEPSARSPLQEEMHARLVGFLEERLAAGEIDPDRLAAGDKAARQEYLALQERWMTTPLPDGRVPMTVLLDEQDEAFLADWAAADAEARAALQSVLDRVGPRPLPAAELKVRGAAAARGHRQAGMAGADARLVQRAHRAPHCRPTTRNCGSPWPRRWPRRRAARCRRRTGSSPAPWSGPRTRTSSSAQELDEPGADGEPDELSAAIAAVCALDHFDWLAVMSALVAGGPGTPASAADLARYVRDFDPDEVIGPTGLADAPQDAGRRAVRRPRCRGAGCRRAGLDRRRG